MKNRILVLCVIFQVAMKCGCFASREHQVVFLCMFLALLLKCYTGELINICEAPITFIRSCTVSSIHLRSSVLQTPTICPYGQNKISKCPQATKEKGTKHLMPGILSGQHTFYQFYRPLGRNVSIRFGIKKNIFPPKE